MRENFPVATLVGEYFFTVLTENQVNSDPNLSPVESFQLTMCCVLGPHSKQCDFTCRVLGINLLSAFADPPVMHNL